MSNAARLVLCALLAAAAGARAYADEPRLRDPMQPYRLVAGANGGTAIAAAPRFRLSAVVISATRRIAVLNGAPRQQGERVDGAAITRIEREAVYLEQDGHTWVIHLGTAAAAAPPSEGVSVQ